MKGYKDSTKTQYFKGGDAHGTKGAAKISKVMGEFKSGALHSGSKKGPAVSNPKQAVAIALSEARKAGAKVPMKKAEGGSVDFERTPASISSNITPPSQSFSEAFRASRNAGEKTFMWNGKKYTTEMAKPSAPKAAAPAPKPAAPAVKAPGPQTMADTARAGAASMPDTGLRLPRHDEIYGEDVAKRRGDAIKTAIKSARLPRHDEIYGEDVAKRRGDAIKTAIKSARLPRHNEIYGEDVAKRRGDAIKGALGLAKGGPVKRTKAVPVAPKGPMIGAKKQMGGMASSIRTNPDLNKQDRRFVEDRASQMRAVVGKPMKKGGRSC